jgi:hypothetical protein
MVIYVTLGNFNRGELSKRDTVSVISDTLGSHVDLKYDLMDILQHQDARWAPGDFDLPQLSRLQPAPSFLQPRYQPQIRLPSIPTLWDFDKQALRSFDSVVMSSFDRRESFGEPEQHKTSRTHTEHDTWRVPDSAMVSSPVDAKPSGSLPIQITTPSVDHATTAQPYANLDHDARTEAFGSAVQDAHDVASWERLGYGNAWSGDGIGNPLPHNQLLSQTAPYETLLPISPRLDHRSGSVMALSPRRKPAVHRSTPSSEPSVLGNPFSMPIGQPAVDMLPPPRKRDRKPSATLKKNDKKIKTSDDSQQTEDSHDQPLSGDQPKLAEENATDSKIPETNRRFIHIVCGKSFATRAKVKKHHWGNKTDDFDTTTGCWARNKKPDVKWNDHPSCKETLPSSNKGRFGSSSTSRSARPKPAPLELQAPLVPTMLPSRRNSQSDIRLLHSLPYPASVAQNSPNTSTSYPWDVSEHHGLLRDEYLSYRSHGLPPRSPFENLLTAVNVAAKIDAPVPQGRTDSVVNHLDAQALAAERDEQFTPAWAFYPHHQDTGYGQHYLPSATGNGLGHYLSSLSLPLPRSAAYASHTNGNNYSSSTMSYPVHSPAFQNPFAPAEFMEEEAKDQDYYLYPPREEEPLGSPTSPGPYQV